MTLAFGVLRGGGVCARVGERVLDLSGLDEVFDRPSLNAFMSRGPRFWREAGEVPPHRLSCILAAKAGHRIPLEESPHPSSWPNLRTAGLNFRTFRGVLTICLQAFPM